MSDPNRDRPRNPLRQIRQTRRPRNPTERDFHSDVITKGWTITRRGWPDFFCIRADGSPCVVEVKRRRPNRRAHIPPLVKKPQAIILSWLASLGIPCFVYDGYVLEAYNPAVHAAPERRRKRKVAP